MALLCFTAETDLQNRPLDLLVRPRFLDETVRLPVSDFPLQRAHGNFQRGRLKKLKKVGTIQILVVTRKKHVRKIIMFSLSALSNERLFCRLV
jgi:hypothetical protein